MTKSTLSTDASCRHPGSSTTKTTASSCRHPGSSTTKITASVQAYRNVTQHHRRVPSLRRTRIIARNRRKAAHLSVSYAHYFADSCNPSSRGLTFRNKRLPGERPLDTDSMVYFVSHTRHFMKWRRINRDIAGLFEKLAL